MNNILTIIFVKKFLLFTFIIIIIVLVCSRFRLMLLTVDILENIHDAGILNSLRALFSNLIILCTALVEIFLCMEKSDLAFLPSFLVSQLQPVVEAQALLVIIKSQIVVSLMVFLISFRLNIINKEV